MSDLAWARRVNHDDYREIAATPLLYGEGVVARVRAAAGGPVDALHLAQPSLAVARAPAQRRPSAPSDVGSTREPNRRLMRSSVDWSHCTSLAAGRLSRILRACSGSIRSAARWPVALSTVAR